MLNLKLTGTVAVLVVTGMLVLACGATATPQPTVEAQQVVAAVVSPTVTPAPTNTPVSESPTDALPPEPSPTPGPKVVPTVEPPPAPEIDASVAYEVRSIEEISVSGLPEIVEITDSDAVLIFESSIPLACSVVYGKSNDYGMISVDQDMGGGAHTDHQPLLIRLEPDTIYHYRVQGTAADGTLYVGEDATFRTPPAEEEAEVNLASLEAGARVVAVSSNFGGAANDQAWGADSAIDGQRGTAWSSNGDGNEAFIEIELAQPSKLHAVEIWTRSMSDGTAQIFSFTLTTDGGEVFGPFPLPDAGQAYRFDLEIIAYSLRLDVVDSSGGNTGLIEFAVYGPPLD